MKYFKTYESFINFQADKDETVKIEATDNRGNDSRIEVRLLSEKFKDGSLVTAIKEHEYPEIKYGNPLNDSIIGWSRKMLDLLNVKEHEIVNTDELHRIEITVNTMLGIGIISYFTTENKDKIYGFVRLETDGKIVYSIFEYPQTVAVMYKDVNYIVYYDTVAGNMESLFGMKTLDDKLDYGGVTELWPYLYLHKIKHHNPKLFDNLKKNIPFLGMLNFDNPGIVTFTNKMSLDKVIENIMLTYNGESEIEIVDIVKKKNYIFPTIIQECYSKAIQKDPSRYFKLEKFLDKRTAEKHKDAQRISKGGLV